MIVQCQILTGNRSSPKIFWRCNEHFYAKEARIAQAEKMKLWSAISFCFCLLCKCWCKTVYGNFPLKSTASQHCKERQPKTSYGCLGCQRVFSLAIDCEQSLFFGKVRFAIKMRGFSRPLRKTMELRKATCTWHSQISRNRGWNKIIKVTGLHRLL